MLGRNGRKKERVCEGDRQGEKKRLPERPMNIVSTHFLRVKKIPIG